ncbi:zinc finger protein GLI4-like [Salarias fasciatus]|uniref:Zinc finger protein GLI4-like n=1 Tax=Salarias fasciatus TaxID=181472 RepID=A0A672IRR0_SALFA|nr:zinc finger protein GLI4-like [Salarias fasciatus]
MSSVQALREFINERLAAAAGEIFTVFEQTIIQYEEEIDRQRRLFETSCNPHRKLHRTEDSEEEQLSNKETDSILDQEDVEPLEMKDDLVEPGTSQEEDQFLLKQETDIFMRTSADKQAPEPGLEHFHPHSSEVAASQVQRRGKRVVSASTSTTTTTTTTASELNSSRSRPTNSVDDCPASGNPSQAQPDKTCLQCGVCGKTFKRASQMLLHHRVHTGEKPYLCGTCGKTFNHKHHLKNHMIIHTDEKPFFCDICSKGFKHKSSYLSHLKIHRGEKPHACDACGKRFCERSNLLVHMRCHTNERPFFCETCGKSYKYRNYLLVHMRTHTGEKPFLCNTCGKGFRTSSAMHKHAVIHTGEKPFSCIECGKCFSVQDTLLRHMMTHVGPRRFQTQE